MSQSVDRLKELLFDTESRELSEMSRRLEVLFERAGTHERFSSSVASVLDSALRKAEVERHAELADAMAPLVVRTVKTEIRNSRDELVEALYPVTGRMVKAYVASAMKDLANDINHRLEANPVMLRLRSFSSGKSVAEIAMAESQQLRIEEIYLVRRGSGELVGRWPESADTDGRDHVMSGILTAINEFSSEALKDEGSALRQIDLGERQLYLRASQNYLLAAKCSGTAPPAVESILDEAFLSALEGLHKDRDTYGSLEAAAARRAALLGDVSRGLDEKISEKQSDLASATAGTSPLMMLAWIIGVPLALWLAWTLYGNYRTERAHLIAAQVIAGTEGIKGYPTRLTVERLGYAITLAGLAPSMAAKQQVVQKLQQALPGTEIRDQLTVLPSGLAEIEPEIEKVRRDVRGLEAEVEPEVAKVKGDLAGFRAGVEPELARVKLQLAALEVQSKRSAVVRAMERANRRLSEASGDLPRLEAAVTGDSGKAVVRRAAGQVEQALKDLAIYKARSAGQGFEGLSELTASLNAQTQLLRKTGADLSSLIASGSGVAKVQPDSGREPAPSEVSESAEELAAETERLATLAVAVSQAMALKNSLPPPAEPTARERLEAWTRANAIFFTNGIDYRNFSRAEKTLDELAQIMNRSSALLRVVGYTDEKGGLTRNSPLSQSRAQKVVDALIARNIPANRLVAVGRLDALDLSPVAGDASPNRRVQFEVGFEGEAAQ